MVRAARSRPSALEGLALGASVTMSPFLGAAFSGVFGVSIALDALGEPRTLAVARARGACPRQFPSLARWDGVSLTGVLEGTSGAMRFGFGGLATHAPVIVLLMSLGPALAPIAMAPWPFARVPRAALASRCLACWSDWAFSTSSGSHSTRPTSDSARDRSCS